MRGIKQPHIDTNRRIDSPEPQRKRSVSPIVSQRPVPNESNSKTFEPRPSVLEKSKKDMLKLRKPSAGGLKPSPYNQPLKTVSPEETQAAAQAAARRESAIQNVNPVNNRLANLLQSPLERRRNQQQYRAAQQFTQQ